MVHVDDALLAGWPLPRHPAHGDKEARGRVVVVAGSPQMPGAAVLAGLAALRAGAGKLAIATPAPVQAVVAAAVWEALVTALAFDADGALAGPARDDLLQHAAQANALLLGPGMATGPAQGCVQAVVQSLGQEAPPLVLDAAAMDAALSEHLCHRADARPPLLLTPHAGEAAHLLGRPKDEVERDPAGAARQLSDHCGAVVVLKGGITHIAAPGGGSWHHEVRCPGLGTSGSGDVLAGLITGLLARGAELAQAAVWGVVLHARAGLRLADRGATLGFLARELPGEVPPLMSALSGLGGSSP